MTTKAELFRTGCRGPVTPQTRVVYLATVLDLFQSPDYAPLRRSLGSYFPQPRWAIFEPVRMPWTTREWLRDWPRLQRWIDALVIWPRLDGSVGFGVYQEACDVQRGGRPVYVISSNRTLRSFGGFVLLKGRSPFRYARARVGKAIRPAKMPDRGG